MGNSELDPVGSPVEPSDHPLDIDALAARWWSAYEATERALRASASQIGPSAVREAETHLAQQHRVIAEILQALARDLGRSSALVAWLGGPMLRKSALGIPLEVRACVFDLDGVLTTSANVHASAWQETFDSFLVERKGSTEHKVRAFDRHREYLSLIAGKPRVDGVRAFLASRGIDLAEGDPGDPPTAATIYGLANRKNELLWRRLELGGVEAFAGARTYLEAARLFGVRRVVVSASANTAAILKRTGLVHLIDERIDGSTMVADRLRPKPFPDALLLACRHIEVEPVRAAAFETTPAGVAAARAAGFRSIVAVNRDGQAGTLQAAGADIVINDLAELLQQRT